MSESHKVSQAKAAKPDNVSTATSGKGADGEQPAGEMSKADQRRERRALQEKQRALKESGKKGTAAATGSKPASNKSTGAPAAATSQKTSETPSTTSAVSMTAAATTTAVSAASKQENDVTKLTSVLKTSLKIEVTSASAAPASANQQQQPTFAVPISAAPTQMGSTTTPTTATATPNSVTFEMAPPAALKPAARPRKNDDDATGGGGGGGSALRNKSKLFQHFEPYKRDYSIIERLSIDNSSIHPAFVRLGIESAHNRIGGSSARCIAFLRAFKEFINSYKPSSATGGAVSQRTLAKDIEAKLKPNINFLTQCRPLSISMGNAIKEMKQVILHLPPETSVSEAKELLHDEIEKFIDERILLASETICKYMLASADIIISGTSYARSQITDDDCLLVYGYSPLVVRVLLEARRRFAKMRVIVVDSRPDYKGRILLDQLIKHDITCTYLLVNAISFVMSKVTKVLLGAQALLANGYVMSSTGSSQIALVAKSFNVPVVVCCETYKFCEKVQTDALVNNELGNPLDLLKPRSTCMRDDAPSPLADWSSESKDYESLAILNLKYDVTSPDLISCVVTDMGMLPCTSVPVVLRLKNRDNKLLIKP